MLPSQIQWYYAFQILTHKKPTIAIWQETEKHRNHGDDTCLQVLLEWAKIIFNLKLFPSSPVLSQFWNTKLERQRIPAIDSMGCRNLDQPGTEHSLLCWVNNQNQLGHCVTDAPICEIAHWILAEVNTLLPDEDQFKLHSGAVDCWTSSNVGIWSQNGYKARYMRLTLRHSRKHVGYSIAMLDVQIGGWC